MVQVNAIGPGGRKRTFKLPKSRVKAMRDKNMPQEEKSLRNAMADIKEKMEVETKKLNQTDTAREKQKRDKMKATNKGGGLQSALPELDWETLSLADTSKVVVQKYTERDGGYSSSSRQPRMGDEVTVLVETSNSSGKVLSFILLPPALLTTAPLLLPSAPALLLPCLLSPSMRMRAGEVCLLRIPLARPGPATDNAAASTETAKTVSQVPNLQKCSDLAPFIFMCSYVIFTCR